MSAVVALVFANGIVRAFRDDREWPGYARQAGIILAPQIAAMVVNVFLGSIALLMFGLLSVLLYPGSALHPRHPGLLAADERLTVGRRWTPLRES